MKTGRKMLIATILVAMILLNCFLPVVRVAANTDVKVTFESNLYSALKDELSRQQINVGYIDEQRTIIIGDEEIAKVTTLSLANSELTDLTGLDIFSSLTVLDLSSNELTKDSNLEVLDELELLSTLDLSSNAIEDVSMITKLDNIPNVSLHNQKFNVVEIIELDTTNTSDEITQKTYALPQILSKAGYLKTEWLIEEAKANGPYINWSRFDHKNLKVEVAQKTGSSYVPYKSMVTLRINVSDSTNTLYNSDINMFFIVVDSDERGIHIPDVNMYNAIKGQLTKNQTVNSDLDSYYATTPSHLKRNLYERYFDEPQVLVVSIDDIINKIQSLKLSNKKIEKLDGIEKFVGLEKELDLSGNYITSIDKLIKLQENQVAEETALRNRVSAQLALVADTITKISTINANIKLENKKIEDLKETRLELKEKEGKLNRELGALYDKQSELENSKITLGNEIESLKTQISNLEAEIKTANESLSTTKKDLVEAQAEKTKLDKELENLNKELADLEAQLEAQEVGAQEAVAAKEAEIVKKEQEINFKNEEINQKQAEIANKQAEIDSKKEELRRKEEEVDTKVATIATYDTEISEIVIVIAEKTEELNLIKADLEVNAAALSSIMTTENTDEFVARWTEEFMTIINDNNVGDPTAEPPVEAPLSEEEVHEINIDITGLLNVYINLYSSGISMTEEEVEEITSLVTDLEKTEEEIREEVTKLNKKIEHAEDFINQNSLYSDMVDKLDEDLLNKIPETAKNSAELWANEIETELLEELKHKSEAVQILADSILETRSVIYEKLTTLETLNTEKTRLQDEIDSLQEEIESVDTSGLEKEKADLEKDKADLEDEKDVLVNARTELETQKTTLETELADLRDALENIGNNTEYKEIQSQITAKQNEIKEKEADIANIEKTIAEKETAIIDLEAAININKQDLETAQNTLSEKEKALETKEKELSEKEKEIAAKILELAKIVSDLNANSLSITQSELIIGELIKNRAALEEILSSQMAKLYKIYNRVDKLASFATSELKTITQEELNDLTFEEAKSMYESQIAKIGKIENILTSFEANYLISNFDIPLKITVEMEKTVQNEDGTTSTETVIEEKDIENPIATYFKELSTEEWTLSDYRGYLNNFRTIDTYFSMIAYCYLVRLNEGVTTCVANEYVDKEIEQLEFDGLSTTHLQNARNNFNNILGSYNCEGIATENLLFAYAAKMVEGKTDINVYVCLPRLKALNVNENLIENIDNVSNLTELRKLYAYDNEIVDISTIDWASMTKLRILDLGFNGIDDIEPLEVLPNIEELYLVRNLISGKFEFNVENLAKIKVLDLSENQIDDIESLIEYLTYEARANGYSDIATFLRNGNIVDIRFNNQILTMNVDKKLGVNETVKVQLPKIFRQIEEIDYSNTSFGINSLRGNVTNDGKEVTLDTTREGNLSALVTIISTGYTPSLGSGTSCAINYTVGTIAPVNVTITSETNEVKLGESLALSSEVTGDNVSYTGVTWEIEGATSENTKISEGGLLTIGLDETADKIIVRATSVYDVTKSCEVEITIIKKQVTEVTITPETATVLSGKNQEFVAEVIGENLEDADKGVTWEIEGAVSADTKISEAGLLTVGLDETADKIIVKATSAYDTTKSCQVEVTILKKQVTEVTINPQTAVMFRGESLEFTAEVVGENLEDADKGIEWDVLVEKASPTLAEGTKASVKDNKLTLSIGAEETIDKFIIVAKSVYDETKVAEAVVTIAERTVSGIKVTPNTATVEKGKTQTFTAEVSGENLRTEDKGVTYAVTGNTSNDTKISNEGVLTVATNEKATTLKVTVTSNLDNTKLAEVVVTVVAPEPSVKLGYTVEEEYIVGVATKTPVDAFKEKLAKDYTVVVKQDNKEVKTGYIKTGMYVEVLDKDGKVVIDDEGNLLVYEVVVKGDVNSDGVADALDSSLIKAIRNEVGTVSDVQMRAADIDDNGKVDLSDSKLLLYHRAEVKDYCLDYTE